MIRPSWDQVWLATAQVVASRSRCDKAQVGAAIVTKDNRVAALSYNGPASGRMLQGSCSNWCPRMMGQETGSRYDSCESIHAEANALLRSNRTEINGGTIYVSSTVCINCAKLIANSGVAKLVHIVRKTETHRDPDQVEAYLRLAGIAVTRAEEVTEL